VHNQGKEHHLQVRSLTVLLALAACTSCGGRGQATPDPTLSPTIEQAVAARTPELMRIQGVVGVGQALCEGAPCIRVYVRTAEVARALPDRLDGYRVEAVVTGMIRL
jgi:hypothetical protein